MPLFPTFTVYGMPVRWIRNRNGNRARWRSNSGSPPFSSAAPSLPASLARSGRCSAAEAFPLSGFSKKRRGISARGLAAEPRDAGPLDVQPACRILGNDLRCLLSRCLQPSIMIGDVKNDRHPVVNINELLGRIDHHHRIAVAPLIRRTPEPGAGGERLVDDTAPSSRHLAFLPSSAERSVGKEGVSTC